MAGKSAKLILSDPGGVIGKYPISAKRIAIGRHGDNDICIEDRTVSAKHALITRFGGGGDAEVQDLNSTNGTSVNGRKVASHTLRDGDIIQVGQHRLKYVQKVGMVTSGPGKTVSDRSSIIKSSRVRLRKARLRILNGPKMGKQIELHRLNTPIGEEGGRRAVIKKRGKDWFLTHLWGDEFPLVNGRSIDTTGYHLCDHDIIEVAGIKLEFLMH